MTAVAGVSRKLFVPETVQTSAMDCGPASLRSLLEGCGIPVSYGRLREACQTDVDGTSIDTMEEVAVQLGLAAEQVLIPADHLLLRGSRALPAIVVVKRPSGETHFVVVWRRHGQFVQVMDPAAGRKWVRCDQFSRELYNHIANFPASAWRKWAGTREFVDPLRRRIRDVGLSSKRSEALLQSSLADESWKSISILDAGVRMVEAIISAGGLKRGRRAGRVLEALLDERRSNDSHAADAIPAMYHSAIPRPDERGEDPILRVRGAVAVRVTGSAEQVVTDGEDPSETEGRRRANLSPELAAALEEKRISPTRQLLSLLFADGFLAPGVLFIALVLAATGIVVEILMFRGLLDIGQQLGQGLQRYVALFALLVFVGGLMLVEIPVMVGLLRWGRRLEVRLRVAFLEKLPRLSDRYFKSRPVSDMAERCHSIQMLRMLPNLGGQLVRSVFAMLLTTLGLIWLDPGCLFIAGAAAITAIVLPLAMQPLLAERDLRMRTHVGALGRFYLDSLLGLVAVRTHAAEPAIRREHHNLLSEWMRAGFGWQRAVIATECVLLLSGLSLAAWLVFDHISRGGETATVLLLVYWALSLPAFGEQIALLARQYPSHRNLTGRLMEPLRAPEEKEEAPGVQDQQDRPATPPSTDEPARGMAVVIKGVEVKAGGHTILRDIDLTVAPGEHVAVVGESGSGKSVTSSTAMGLLPENASIHGQVELDGVEIGSMSAAQRRRLRGKDISMIFQEP
ncbi:MAG: ATP-binding cassette domain-containing protein, partial [Planctomycetes bacterium]|nr:ATP-binding cassette domain-containing protein [Planctomycetota bacterium]